MLEWWLRYVLYSMFMFTSMIIFMMVSDLFSLFRPPIVVAVITFPFHPVVGVWEVLCSAASTGIKEGPSPLPLGTREVCRYYPSWT